MQVNKTVMLYFNLIKAPYLKSILSMLRDEPSGKKNNKCLESVHKL